MMRRTPLRNPGFNLAFIALLAFPAMGAAQYEEPPPPAAYALENVTVVHADGRKEAGVTIVVRRGLIQALGLGIEVPADALVLEGDSLMIYPGLVDAHGDLELDLPTLDGMAGVLSWDPPREAQGFTPHRLLLSRWSGRLSQQPLCRHCPFSTDVRGRFSLRPDHVGVRP
jgi:hypothetical protein